MADPETNRLYVVNAPYDTTEEDMRPFFEKSLTPNLLAIACDIVPVTLH
jgi:RNA recognition motif-containing protein